MKRNSSVKEICTAVLLGMGFVTSGLAGQETPETSRYRDETPAEHDARMQWWRDAKFGLFIHWGIYAVPEGEWNENRNHAEWIKNTARIPGEEYDKCVDQFNPKKFDAERWVSLAQRAGMKYLVITTKHHDGFCLWPSDLTEYDIASTPFKRDVLGELKKACDKHDVRFCTYYSIMDWHHPKYHNKREFADYVAYMNGQLKELVDRYDTGVIWFDGGWNHWNEQHGYELQSYVRSLKPGIIINNRVGNRQFEHKMGDFGTPEREVPAEGIPGKDWESCLTMRRHWGWNKYDTGWRKPESLVRTLVDIASKGGNLLLNVGPKPDGTLADGAIERLNYLGDWMEVNAESIHGTTASPFGKVPFGRLTAKLGENTLYLHVYGRRSGWLDLPKMSNPVRSAVLLADPKTELKVESTETGGVRIAIPENAPDTTVWVVKLKYEDELIGITPIPTAEGDIGLSALLADMKGSVRYAGDQLCLWMIDGSVHWRPRIESPGDYEVTLLLACADSDKGAPFEVKIGDQVIKGTVPATGGETEFKPVSMGTVTLKKGDRPLSVSTLDKRDKPIMYLRQVKLTPKKEME